MKRPRTICTKPGCHEFAETNGRRCEPHRTAFTHERFKRLEQHKGSSTARGYDGRHRKLRTVVLQRDPYCKLCERAYSTQADHVVPLSQGGTTTLDNMQGVCAPCNRRKAAKEAAAARQAG